jgi:hypothetical protein
VRFKLRRVKGLERVQDPFFKYAGDFFLGGDICRKKMVVLLEFLLTVFVLLTIFIVLIYLVY